MPSRYAQALEALRLRVPPRKGLDPLASTLSAPLVAWASASPISQLRTRDLIALQYARSPEHPVRDHFLPLALGALLEPYHPNPWTTQCRTVWDELSRQSTLGTPLSLTRLYALMWALEELSMGLPSLKSHLESLAFTASPSRSTITSLQRGERNVIELLYPPMAPPMTELLRGYQHDHVIRGGIRLYGTGILAYIRSILWHRDYTAKLISNRLMPVRLNLASTLNALFLNGVPLSEEHLNLVTKDDNPINILETWSATPAALVLRTKLGPTPDLEATILATLSRLERPISATLATLAEADIKDGSFDTIAPILIKSSTMGHIPPATLARFMAQASPALRTLGLPLLSKTLAPSLTP